MDGVGGWSRWREADPPAPPKLPDQSIHPHQYVGPKHDGVSMTNQLDRAALVVSARRREEMLVLVVW